MGGGGRVSIELVRTCIVEDCHCYPYRFGTNPNRGDISEEHKAKMLAGLQASKVVSRTRTRAVEKNQTFADRYGQYVESIVVKRTRTKNLTTN